MTPKSREKFAAAMDSVSRKLEDDHRVHDECCFDIDDSDASFEAGYQFAVKEIFESDKVKGLVSAAGESTADRRLQAALAVFEKFKKEMETK